MPSSSPRAPRFLGAAFRKLVGASSRELHEDGGHLDVDAVFGLAARTLPYLGPALRELRPLVPVALLVLIFGIPTSMLLTDLTLNRMLAGNPLTAFEASLLRLDPDVFVAVEKLRPSDQGELRDRLLIGMAVFMLALIPFLLWFANVLIRIRQQINQLLRVEMMERVQAMSMRFHSGSRVGDSVYKTYQDSAMVTNLMGLLVSPIGPLYSCAVGFVSCFLFDWRLPLSLALLYFAAYQVARKATPSLRRDFRLAREQNSALTSQIQETLAGIRVIKAYGAEEREQTRFEDASRAAFDAAFEARSRFALMNVLCFVLTALPPMFATAYLAVLAAEGRPLAAGFALGFAGFAVWNLGAHADATRRVREASGSTRGLLNQWCKGQDMAVGMQRAFSQVDMKPEVQDAEDAVELPPLREGIRFREVSFAYQPERPVLEEVSLFAPVGSVTALVGPTGSGKSTLASLLLRLFDPDEGRIEFDGVDLRRYTIGSLREQVGIALQENLLFGTTIRENIRYAVPDASDEQVREAARIACANEFIEATPQGYDTLLGERGTKLSTGQRQRLSIARAVIKDTPVLILDEPTASLDAETELAVLRNLAEWGRDRAIFLVTHRLSTIRRSDQIVVLGEGRVVEAGSHEELIAREGGAYRRLVEIESGGPESLGAPS